MAGNFASLVNTLNRFAVLAHCAPFTRITLVHPLPRLLLRSLIPLHGFLALKTSKNLFFQTINGHKNTLRGLASGLIKKSPCDWLKKQKKGRGRLAQRVRRSRKRD
jgi:hypothetical protein